MDPAEGMEEEHGGSKTESHEVIQIVLGEVSNENMKLLPVDGDDQGQGRTASLTAVTGEDGITYIQVEGSEMAASLLQAMANGDNVGGEGDEEMEELDREEGEGRQVTVTLASDDYTTAIAEATSEVITGDVVDGSSQHQQQQFILQSPPNYKLELLQSIALDASSDAFLDFPVFCQDGVAWSSRLLLAAMSGTIRSVLAELGDREPCLVLPELTRVEFATFHRALFAKEGDSLLDFILLIKVAELLGAELFLTTSFPASQDPFPIVDYKTTMDSYQERKKVYRSLGYEVEGDLCGRKREDALAHLSSILGSEVSCDLCCRTFVDEVSLKKHNSLLHIVKPLTRSSSSHECDICKKQFNFAVSVKKHKWLSHTKAPRPSTLVVVPETERVSDKATAKLKRVKEKFEDMRCSLCGVESTTWKQLQIHMMDHTKERPFKCKTCGKGFKEPQKLRRHNVTHTGEKNHVCKFCNKAFGLRHNMRSHERIHLGQGHFCRYCGKMFSQVTNLREHEDVHAKRGHVVTDDDKVQKTQEFVVKKRGRPSIMDMDKKRKQTEQEEEEDGGNQIKDSENKQPETQESTDKPLSDAASEERLPSKRRAKTSS